MDGRLFFLFLFVIFSLLEGDSFMSFSSRESRRSVPSFFFLSLFGSFPFFPYINIIICVPCLGNCSALIRAFPSIRIYQLPLWTAEHSLYLLLITLDHSQHQSAITLMGCLYRAMTDFGSKRRKANERTNERTSHCCARGNKRAAGNSANFV
jgi:hypothetical protein